MPVNGIELKEGQKWKTLYGGVATLQDNPRVGSYIFRTVYEDGEWDTVTKDGKRWTSDYDSFLRELIYDPEQQVKEKLIMKFNPQPGDKIICNNGEEFICCTKEQLKMCIDGIFETKDIVGLTKDGRGWQDWNADGTIRLGYDDWAIREVVPQSAEGSADEKEEVKEEPRYKAATEEQPLYTLQEIKEAWDASAGWDDFKNELMKINNPQYQEYLRLKAIYD